MEKIERDYGIEYRLNEADIKSAVRYWLNAHEEKMVMTCTVFKYDLEGIRLAMDDAELVFIAHKDTDE